MKKKLKLLLAVGAALTLVVSVAPALAGKGGNGGGKGAGGASTGGTTTSTISLDQAGQALALGDPVTFTTTVAGLKGGEYPMVYLECSSATDGSLLYGQLDHPDVTFVLGGGSSRWWQVGGAADCLAHLYAYGGKTNGGYDTIRELAVPVAFDTAG